MKKTKNNFKELENMVEKNTEVPKGKKREITQEEMDDFLCFCEEFLWIEWFDKLIVKDTSINA